ncbi:MAG: hypothetical protein IPI73_04700 [Betaproteobacteria bacterium]|nr:hypothetical protein [Betaproteobacteria bacterium]
MKPAPRWLAALLALLCGAAGAAEEFTFDASEFEKKPLEFSGYFEFRPESFRLNQDGAFYKLNFYDLARRDNLNRATVAFKPAGKLRLGGDATLNFRGTLDYQRDSLGSVQHRRVDEAFVSWKPDPGFTADAGKIALRWGKGYAWSPVAFAERTKDPNDPELAREGFALLSADVIRNFDGALQTVAFTPVLLPVSGSVNSDFGAATHLNAAAKLYLLYRDTDIDFMYLNNGSRTRRFGFDFSRNLGTSLEIHGEWARTANAQHQVADPAGNVRSERLDGTSYLLGMRYLSERETTTIVEYYRNGAGYDTAQLRDYSRLVDNGLARFQAGGGDLLLQRAAGLAQGGYGQSNPGRRYLYLRTSQNEPFDTLYLNVAVTAIANLDDRSFSIAPELLYTRVRNLELRLRLFFLQGGSGSDFGEKQNDRRLEFRMRYFL